MASHKVASWVSPFVAFGVFVSMWAGLGTGYLFQPGAIAYHKNARGEIVATWTRSTPTTGVWLDWYSECQSVNGGEERHERGRSFYQPTNDPVEYIISGQTVRCFEAGLPVLVRHSWQAYLFGVIPLRPVKMSYTVSVLPEVAG